VAYTKTPENQTYRTFPYRFDGFPTYRSGDLAIQRDCNIVNMFYDRVSQENKTREVYLKKRYGLRTTAYSLSKATPATDNLRGHYYDVSSNTFYWATNNKVYSVAPDVGTTIRTVCTLATSEGLVGFCEFLKASTSKRLVLISDGTDLWVDDHVATTCTAVSDPDLPSPHVPQPRAINGYAVLAGANSGDLYNSVNDDPTSWEPGDYITTEMSGDYITMLAHCRNYIVAFGTNSLEMFWDSAQVSGSPFSRNESGFRNVGYVSGLCMISNVAYFLGQNVNGGLEVFKLDGFDLKSISTPIVNQSIQPTTSTDNVKGQINAGRTGYSVTMAGHTFYVLASAEATWAFDIDENIWYEWRDTTGAPLAVQGTWCMYNGAQYVAIDGQEYMSMFAPTVYQDFGANFSCIYTTERFAAESMHKKTMSRLILVADTYQTTGTSNVVITWSDDDWASTSGTRDINVFSPRPVAHQFGQFITRSFRMSYTDAYPLRMRGLEFEINIGVN
jgi:hypothetical protein